MTETSHIAKADQYTNDVLSGRIPACQWIRLACQRYLTDKARNDDPSWPYYFDSAAASKVCRFVELFEHSKGKWAQQRERMKLEPWQCWVLVNVFGFLRKKDGKRRFRYAMVVVPRKNGKSALSAPIGLYMLAADGEHGAEVYSGATSEKQALEVFRPARLLALKTPAFLGRFGVEANASNLHILANGSRFEPLIGKPGDGSSPSCAIIDEFHEHDTPDLRDTMVTGMGAREQPLVWVITTAGDNLAGPCFDDVLTGRKLVQGAIEDEERFYAEWTIDADDDWTSPEALIKANPNYGVSVDGDFLLAQQRAAIRNPREQGRFKTKHLNSWVNSRSAFFNMQSHSANYDASLTMGSLKGRRCFVGMDLASKQDIAAMQILFPLDDGTFATFGRYYLPEDVVFSPGKDHYRAWQTNGELIITDGNMIDHQRILDDLLDIIAEYDVEEVVFDPAQASWMMGQLMERRVTVYEFTQHARNYSEPMKQVAALMDAGKLKHADSPNSPMAWMLSNCVSRTNAKDEVFPAKEKEDLKIDGPVALIMSMARAMANVSTKSVYEARGLLVIG
ncbi:terminase large subunit [Paracraurococcus lichenis]|uniref:Terminase large subunit n=1 Tax=Paracraurococcus lichenis TaxID=3064888 RepID=A0ABT9E725_9PROT|nr:terminase TerL endonuclease subunit [Paracraurococcus sp. LOR1-02]MDO9711979.1 terminase large subunit [Paracraurococcus sp. LOR1-02]